MSLINISYFVLAFLVALAPVVWLIIQHRKKSAKIIKLEKFKENVNKHLEEKGTGKIGIVEFRGESYYDYIRGVVEIEEIKRAGGLTKVKVIRVCPDKSKNFVKNEFRKHVDDWIDENRITWLDGWEQRRREMKLDDLLEDEIKELDK